MNWNADDAALTGAGAVAGAARSSASASENGSSRASERQAVRDQFTGGFWHSAQGAVVQVSRERQGNSYQGVWASPWEPGGGGSVYLTASAYSVSGSRHAESGIGRMDVSR